MDLGIMAKMQEKVENKSVNELPAEIIQLYKENKQPRKSKKHKKLKEKKFEYEDFYKITNVTSHTEFENYLREIVFKPEERKEFYDKFLEIQPKLGTDSFKPYFELYSAERKTNQQDYTPESVAHLLSYFTRDDPEQHGDSKYTAYDMTAGTGTLLINKWHDDRMQESPWSYAPHRYFYMAEEMADNSIPYLIHNLAMRGMNAIVVHGDSLHRKIKQIYFIQNSDDDFMAYSDVNVLPHTKDAEEEFDVREWLQDEIDHVESQKVVLQYALPMKRKGVEISDKPPEYEVITPWSEAPQLKDLAIVERAKKGKMYGEGSIIIQVSATDGQVGQLKSDGSVDSKYVVVCANPYIYGLEEDFLFYYLQYVVPRWFHRVQQGLNVTFEDVEKIPIMFPVNLKREYKKIQYGQLSLF